MLNLLTPHRDLRGDGVDLPGRAPRRASSTSRHRHARRDHADPDVLHRLRPVDGLRGVPALPHQGGARPHAATTTTSVALGLERTGRIVTAAAALHRRRVPRLRHVAASRSSSCSASASRSPCSWTPPSSAATLVPAFMRLAGDANWWAPAPLRRIHERFGISEIVDEEPPSEPPAPTAPAPREPVPV